MSRPLHLSVLLPALVIAGTLPAVRLRAQIQNPIQSIKDAYNKAKQQSKQQQQQQQQQQQPQQQNQQQSTQQQATTTASGTTPPAQGAEAPWVPPSDSSNPAIGPAASAPPVKIDSTKMPDILGVHLGMTLPEALAAAHKPYPDDMYQEKPANYWPSATKPEYGYNILNRTLNNSKDMVISFTAPPDTQRAWKIERETYKIHTNRGTLLAALREKYGKETIAFQSAGNPTTNDAAMTGLMWLYDEQGNRAPLPPSTVFTRSGSIEECRQTGGMEEPNMPKDDEFERNYTPWCQAHLVALQITIGPLDIVENTTTVLIDVPLAIRNSHAAAAFLRDYAQHQHQLDLERSKEKKPAL